MKALQMGKQPGESLDVRDVILQSWTRSKENKDLNPLFQGSVKNIKDMELKELMERNDVYRFAQPLLKQAEQELSHTNHVILFADSEGTILNSFGKNSVVSHLGSSVNANIGANWSERWAGTNGIGLSLLLKQPVQIFSSEHFSYRCHEWVCSAAPIMDPLTDELLGVINLSTTTNHFEHNSMLKTFTLANQIERVLFHHYYQAREMLQNIYFETSNKWKNHIILLSNSNGQILKSNSTAPVDEAQSFMTHILESNVFSKEKEWQNEVHLYGAPYKAIFKKIYWQGRFIGFMAILEKKDRSNYAVTSHNHNAKYSLQSLVGKSKAFTNTIRLAEVAASGDSNVLITGDSGTGKELVANAIHNASNRSDHPFIAINCAAIPKELLPSELFGYVAGAFTGANPKGSVGKFELANKGTLFLDELGDMPLESQVQLLRVIQEQEIVRIGGKKRIPIDVRLIAATNKNLSEEIELGNFRKDLYYRLNVIHIELPSLRHRIDDLPLLVERFIQKLTVKKYNGPYQITAEAMEMLKEHPWPGNIRELENVIEYAINFSTNGLITPENLPKQIQKQKSISKQSNMNPVNQAELDWIISTLKRSQMNVSKAAKELKMSRSTLYRKLNKMGYNVKELK
ncbi:sigma-54-dependent Fis family transcriptional regulator [Fictibacillus enclensis]|uniref:sigma-54-dependent Fis family transcriptional regulator n=1 Tax=Fictibacillus enclensis TaxID=1017270 RepID=UPI0025A1CB0E|nr:sigma-54-dependent Fis family transcriptional regulator [Fictibacillus enclensis]MDM5339085.1 sigma-54-dependent Fis family transcriptional regulator [Fictibacillus enclensis]